MTDIGTTAIVTLAAELWGAAGGFIYCALPKRPEGAKEFGKRIGVGFVVGAVWYALGGLSPFSGAGTWDVGGVTKLVTASFTGLAGIAAFFPQHLNEDARQQMAAASPVS